MPDSKFTLSKAVDDFQLKIVEGDRFLPEISPVNPSSLLKDTLCNILPQILHQRQKPGFLQIAKLENLYFP